jgi:hypothetical protein
MRARLFGFLLGLAAVIVLPPPGPAQASAFNDPLLDHYVGTWVLRGTIGGAQTVHDVSVDWVLGHQYLRIHEVSREKDVQGQPAYEAIVFLGADPAGKGFACLWLDNTGGGGLKGGAIGHAVPKGDEIPIVFAMGAGVSFHTTFVYDRKADAWDWRMDENQNGKLTPFARIRMTRK